MGNTVRLLLIWMGTVSVLALLLFGWDKWMARLGRRRIPELALWWAALMGGGVGAALGMRLFRHKLRKRAFRVGLPLLGLLQLGLVAWALWAR